MPVIRWSTPRIGRQRFDGLLGPAEAGVVDGKPVLEGKTRVAAGKNGGRFVVRQLVGERRERDGQVLHERAHLVGREQVLHQHEAHEVQAEVRCDGGGFYRVRNQAR